MSSQATLQFEATVPPIHFEYRKGAFLSRVQLHLIFWGAHWDTDQHPSRAEITDSVKRLIRPGGYLSGLAQYNPLGCEPVVELVETRYDLDPEKAPKKFQDDADHSDIVDEVTSLMGAIERVLPPDPRAQPLYAVFMPPGSISTSLEDGEPKAGEHGWFVKDGQRRIYYAWVLHGSIERMTIAFSEELVEAITDPEPPCCDDSLSGWVMKDNQGEFQEVCDICESITATVDGVRVQTYFSNEKKDCIAPPAIPL
jgi:hypothetical protein